jgi:hypothetical protein
MQKGENTAKELPKQRIAAHGRGKKIIKWISRHGGGGGEENFRTEKYL